MTCPDCPDLPNGTRKRATCCKREGLASGGVVKGERVHIIGERPCELKVGGVVPLAPRKLDVRPAFTGAGSPSFKAARHANRGPGK